MTSQDRQHSVEALFARRVQQAFPSIEEARERIAGEQPLTFYLGIDPTGPYIHLGHVVPLLLLNDLSALGHRAILLIGDFTARIGDPTGKDADRKTFTESEVRTHAETYLEQIERVIPGHSFEVQYNNTWLSELTMEQVLRLAGMVTVQQMLARDMFQERLKEERPIHVSEFLYPLMQGYDSVAMKVDGEIGGNDQIFNMLVGRDLERTLLNKDKLVLATPLLTVSGTGKKMSKSEGTLIAVLDSPREIRRKVLNFIDDKAIRSTLELCTTLPLSKIDELEQTFSGNPRGLKEALSDTLVTMFHGEQGIEPSRAPEESSAKTLIDAVAGSEAAGTVSEAKRLIDQGAVEVNGKVEKEWRYELRSGDSVNIGNKFLLTIV